MKVKVSLEDRRRGVESTKISGRDLKRHSSERKSGGGKRVALIFKRGSVYARKERSLIIER